MTLAECEEWCSTPMPSRGNNDACMCHHPQHYLKAHVRLSLGTPPPSRTPGRFRPHEHGQMHEAGSTADHTPPTQTATASENHALTSFPYQPRVCLNCAHRTAADPRSPPRHPSLLQLAQQQHLEEFASMLMWSLEFPS
jgi:hypothetical protein